MVEGRGGGRRTGSREPLDGARRRGLGEGEHGEAVLRAGGRGAADTDLDTKFGGDAPVNPDHEVRRCGGSRHVERACARARLRGRVHGRVRIRCEHGSRLDEQVGNGRGQECPRRRLYHQEPHVPPNQADNSCTHSIGRRVGRLEAILLGSFKVKLALYFALLALLPLAVTFYGYATLAKRSEARRVDARLQAGLRSVVAGYAVRLDAADATAGRIALDSRVQSALRTGDASELRRVARGDVVVSVGGRVFGTLRSDAATRSVAVMSEGRTLGRVTVAVPVDGTLLRWLHAGLDRHDRLVAWRDGEVVAGPFRGAALELAEGRAARVGIAGGSYRGLATAPLPEPAGISLVLLAPQHAIDVAARVDARRLLLPLIASLLVFALVTYLLGRSIVRTLRQLADAANALAGGRLDERVEVRGRDEFAQLGRSFNRMAAQLEQRLVELDAGRRRLRDQRTRFGAALAATLDREQLLEVIVESAVETTGASGGVVFGDGAELARIGDPEGGPAEIVVPLAAGRTTFGTLVLRGHGFNEEQHESAGALATQAALALENVRLHRMVEGQALEDALTGLANRRSLDRTLAAAVAQAGRAGEDVCLVLADLDDFKKINDRHGHPCGDMVLREFALELHATVREGDVAGRWGGEEFALVLRGTDARGGAQLAERARAHFAARELPVGGDASLNVTASFGVAAFPTCADVRELVAAADDALYRAKRNGKNRVATAVASATR